MLHRLGLRSATRRGVPRIRLAARTPRQAGAAGLRAHPYRRAPAGARRSARELRQPDLSQPRGDRDRGRPRRFARRRRRLSRPPRDRLSRHRRACGARRGGQSRAGARARRMAQLPRRRRRALRRPRRGARGHRPGARRARRLFARVGDADRVPRRPARSLPRSLAPHAPPAAFRPPHAVAPQLPSDPGGPLPPLALGAARRLRRGHGPARGLESLDALHARGRLRAGREDDLQVPRSRGCARDRPEAGAARQRLCRRARAPARARRHALAASHLRDGGCLRARTSRHDGHTQRPAALPWLPPRARAPRRLPASGAARDAPPGVAAVNADNRPGDDLPFTGERFVPGVQGEIWIEHWHRYHFARRFVAGKRVLDVACGEGYGSALLAREAAHVTGVDLSQPAIDHAQRTYGARENIEFACAPCTHVPLADASVDVVGSFETIQHLSQQAEFVDEIARVLRPDGLLVISCPNKSEYTDKRGFRNEFHVKELYRDELGRVVHSRFPASEWYGQRLSYFSVIAPEEAARAGQVVETSESRPDESSPVLAEPLYFVIVASRAREALGAIPAALSVLSDREELLREDHAKAMRDVAQH